MQRQPERLCPATSSGVTKSAEPTPDLTALARAALTDHPLPLTQLVDALTALYTDAYLAGGHAASVQGVGLTSFLADLDSAVDWGTWTPGDSVAAGKAADGGLARLLSDAEVTIRGIVGSALDRLGDQIAQGIAEGKSTDQIAAGLDGFDRARAELIARTEVARAVSAASLDCYQTSGVTSVRWLVADPCDVCQTNEDAGPQPTGATFPGGVNAPPQHPSCMCALSPEGV